MLNIEKYNIFLKIIKNYEENNVRLKSLWIKLVGCFVYFVGLNYKEDIDILRLCI